MSPHVRPPQECWKKPRKVCQTLVTLKPKIVTEKVPKEVCEDYSLKAKNLPPSSSAPFEHGKTGDIPAADLLPPSNSPAEIAAPSQPPPAAEEIPSPAIPAPAETPSTAQPNGFDFMEEEEVGGMELLAQDITLLRIGLEGTKGLWTSRTGDQ